MIGSVIALLLMGLIVGAVAKFLVPGRDPGGLVVTAIIGVAGALLGGFLASAVLDRSGAIGFNLYTFVVGVVGAVILLLLYHGLNGDLSRRRYRSRARPTSRYRRGRRLI
ncbi:MAG TPA: GlsB/YeaQ/YmgE family stress response membrane protein [Actinomycetes bacterium]|jgi:uncharacterized membrane protein YeaQ/YmgE (transglycosylase-associated protein family)|nr:GlsB/YeaQ/YmgE family stress response membrane protein [Actinomycetes bacterium]